MHYLPKGIINNCNVVINGKKIYYQPINCDIKRYEGISKITTEKGKDYTTKCYFSFCLSLEIYKLVYDSEPSVVVFLEVYVMVSIK